MWQLHLQVKKKLDLYRRLTKYIQAFKLSKSVLLQYTEILKKIPLDFQYINLVHLP